MLRLTCIREREDGAIATIVAMLFFFGVMLAIGALTVDVGNINADRRQLQNGADAVALAVAQTCAKTGTCDPTDPNLQILANANAADGATSITRVDGQRPLDPTTGSQTTDLAYPAICGNVTSLYKCDPDWIQNMSTMSNLQECPSTPSGVNYVRVYAETKNSADQRNILPYYFGAAITGIEGANQQACATVIFGPPSGAAAPITLSYCEWAAATGYEPPLISGEEPVFSGVYAPDPVYPDPVGTDPGYGGVVQGVDQPHWPAPADQLTPTPTPTSTSDIAHEIIIGLQGTTTTSTCPTWNTHDAPGGFGYLSSDSGAGCLLTAPVNGWINANTGNHLPHACESLLPYFQKVLYLPVFDCSVAVTGSDPVPTEPPEPGDSCIPEAGDGAGANTWYYIMGYAKFYLSGYRTSGSGVPDKNNDRTQSAAEPKAPCGSLPGTADDRCLSGWFLKGLVDAPPASSQPAGSPSLGAYSIKLAG